MTKEPRTMRAITSTVTFSVVAIFAIASLAARAAGTDEDMRFFNSANVDRVALRNQLVAAGRSEVVLQRATLDMQRQPISGVDEYLEIDVRKLFSVLASADAPSGFGFSGSTALRIPVGDKEVALATIDVNYDRAFDLHHISAVSLDDTSMIGRFTVDLEAGRLLGTIFADGSTWSIFPVPDSALHATRAAGRDDRVRSMDIRFRAQERRHDQMVQLAASRPSRFHMTESGQLVSVSAERLESIDLRAIVARSGDVNRAMLGAELEAAFARMETLFSTEVTPSFRVTSVSVPRTRDRGEIVVRFSQLLAGVPVEPGGVAVIDAASGVVTGLAIPLVRSSAATMGAAPLIGSRDAIVLAEGALVGEYGKGPAEGLSASLVFSYRDELTVLPQWVVSVLDNSGERYVARIDAQTGEASVYPTALSYFKQTVCESNGGQVNCGTTPSSNPAIWRVSDNQIRLPEGVARCYPTPNSCQQRYMDAFETVEDVEDFILGAAQGTWDRIEVVADVPSLPEPSYDNGAVRLPAPGSGGYLAGADPLAVAHQGVLVHEIIHHHQVLNGPDPQSDNLLRALAEGMADAAAGLFTGNWAIGQGTMQQASVRDLTVPKDLDDYPGATVYQSSQVFGNMIYRVSTKSGVSDSALSNLILETYKRMSPSKSGDAGEYELGDVFVVMDEIAQSNQSLREAISEVLTEMGGTAGGGTGDSGGSGGGGSGGIPPTSGAPPAPGYVEGHFLTCNGGIAVHFNNWQYVFGATSYEVYYRPLANPGAPYIYDATTTQTSGTSVNSIDVSVKIKACNSSGCSWLSYDSYQQLDDCP